MKVRPVDGFRTRLAQGSITVWLLATSACASIAGLDQYGESNGDGGAPSSGASGGAGAGVGGSGGMAVVSYEQVVLVDGPEGYWRFGELEGDLATSAVPGGPSGSYENDVQLGTPGAIALDRDSAITIVDTDQKNEHVNMGPVLPSATGEHFTVEIWAKPGAGFNAPGDCDPGGIATREGSICSGSNDRPGWSLLWISNCRVTFTVGQCSEAEVIVSSSTRMDDTERWYHLVATFDGSEATLYVDTVLEGVDSLASAPELPDNAELVFGARHGGNFGHFRGSLDEAVFYRKLLPVLDISEHFEVGTRSR